MQVDRAAKPIVKTSQPRLMLIDRDSHDSDKCWTYAWCKLRPDHHMLGYCQQQLQARPAGNHNNPVMSLFEMSSMQKQLGAILTQHTLHQAEAFKHIRRPGLVSLEV